MKMPEFESYLLLFGGGNANESTVAREEIH